MRESECSLNIATRLIGDIRIKKYLLRKQAMSVIAAWIASEVRQIKARKGVLQR
jgi:hypothetical protein